jgi:replicative DNA helicase
VTRRRAEEPPVSPHDLEAERATLGAILIRNNVYEQVSGVITEADFFRMAHRLIFRAIAAILSRRDGRADLVTLKAELVAIDRLGDVGGLAYIAGLVDGVPSSTNAAHYAKVVRELAIRRELIAHGNALVAAAYQSDESAHDLLTKHDQAVLRLQHGRRESRAISIGSKAADILEQLEDRHKHRGELIGLPTGFQRLNDLTLGWQPGDMIVVAARPSIGKSAIAMNMITAVARSLRPDGRRRRVVVFSMEMTELQWRFRLCSSLSGVDGMALLGGHVYSDEQWARVSAAVAEMGELDITIDDTSGRTWQDIRSELRRVHADGGLDLVVVDYVQLIRGSLARKGSNRTEELTEISRSLKTMADEFAVPMIVVSQLKRTDGIPQLSDLRECGALEQDAALVFFLHRKHHKDGGLTRGILAKHRNGPTGTINLLFQRETTTFTDAPDAAGQASASDEESENEASDESTHQAKIRAMINARARGGRSGRQKSVHIGE